MKDFEPHVADLKENDFMFLLDSDIKIDFLEKLGFPELYPSLTKVEFDGVCSYLKNLWQMAFIFTVTDMNASSRWNNIFERMLKDLFAAGIDPSQGFRHMDISEITRFIPNLADKRNTEDIRQLAANLKLGQAAKVFQATGVKKEYFAKCLNALGIPEIGEVDSSDIDNVTNLLLNPPKDIKDMTFEKWTSALEEGNDSLSAPILSSTPLEENKKPKETLATPSQTAKSVKTKNKKKKPKKRAQANQLQLNWQGLLEDPKFLDAVSHCLQNRQKSS